MFKTILKCSAMSVALTLPHAAWAQSASEGEIIVTATGAGSNPNTVGQAITRLNLNIIEQRQKATVSDLLDAIPGVTVSRSGGIGTNTAIRIRGAEGDQTLALIDGVRVNDPSSPGGGFDFGNLLTGNIQRIEVFRGPNSVPWGSQAIGGIVNIVTSAADNGITGRTEYGGQDRFNLVGNAGITSGILSANLGGGYFREDGISSFKDGAEPDGYRQYAANGKIGIALSEDLDIDLRGYYADSKTQLDGFPPPNNTLTDTSSYSTAQELFGYAGVNFRLFDARLKNRLSFTVSDIDRDNFDIAGQAGPSFFARGRTQRYEYQGDAAISDAIRIVFGAEHEYSKFNDGFTYANTDVTSGYGQAIVNFGDMLTITGGARVDKHKNYGTQVTVSGNAAWRPAEGTIIRAAYGEGFKAPTLYQLYSDYGNVSLHPEQARSYELGVEQTLIQGQLVAGVTAFLRDGRNQIGFISCYGQSTGICTNRPYGTYNNVNRARAQGIEFLLNIRPADSFTINANYTYVKSEDRSTGLTLLRRPKHDVNLYADWQPLEKLNLGASLQLVSDSIDINFETYDRTALDGYALLGLHASYQMIDGISLFGRVDNVTDENYETVSGFGTYGRNAYVGVRAKF
jgi:vitamin B12 transporter